MLFADLDTVKLEKIKAIAEAISVKYQNAEKVTLAHMQQWEKQKGNKRPDWRFPIPLYKLPRNKEKRAAFELEHAAEIAKQREIEESHQKVHTDFNQRFMAERERVFKETLCLTAEEELLYATVGHHHGASFEIEEVPTPT